MMDDESLSSYLSEQEDAMFSLLEELVLIQSGTGNKTGVDRVGECITSVLAELDLRCVRIGNRDLGDHLLFSTPACGKNGTKKILLTGHMDTVFPKDCGFNGYEDDGEKITGPGVIDMKGGLVTMIYTVKALAAHNLLGEIPLTLFFNSDEEIGSPSSAPLLRDEAGRSCCALVFECGGLNGEVVTGRRGKRGYRLQINGRAGHAAFAGTDKPSAILELARQIDRLEALNDPDRQVVVNVGKIEGGIGPNTVADSASALIDTRFPSQESGEWLAGKIELISSGATVNGTQTALQVTNTRPVMEQRWENHRLFELYRRRAESLGLPVREESRQGVSDANTLAEAGIPVLDGLGPIGEHDHSEREYMIKQSLPQRTRILSLFLPDLYRTVCAETKKS